MNITIPGSTTFTMAALAMLNTVIPIIIAYHYRKRFSVKVSTFFIGLVGYMLFAMLLIQFPDVLIRGGIKPFAHFVNNTPLAAALYFAFLTALVEGLGKFVMFKTMMKSREDQNEALMFGVGYGGIQAMFVGSSVMMSNAILAISINAFGAQEYINKLGLTGEELEQTTKGIIEFSKIPLSQHLFDGTVPLILMAAQIALSYLVYHSIANKAETTLLPLSIAMHFVLLLPLYLVRKAVINNTVVIELIMLLLAMGIIYFALQLYQKRAQAS